MAEKKVQETQEYFQKAAEAQTERFETMIEEVAKMESKGTEQLENSIDEIARIWKSSLHYTIELNEHMRAMMVESTKRTMGWMNFGA